MLRIELDVAPRLSPHLEQQLRTHLQHYQRLKQRQEALDAEVERWHGKIGDLSAESGQDVLDIDGFKVTHVAPNKSQFNRRKFIQMGGDLAVYDAAHETVPGTPYERITLPKEQPE